MLKKAHIQSFDCADVSEDLSRWVPDDPFEVDLWINLTIGLDGDSGGNNFQLHILTTQTVKNHKGKKKYSIVLKEYSWEQVLQSVDRILSDCVGYDWHDISAKLSERMQWEYEGYKG